MHSYFKLSVEGAFVWEQLDGQHTLQEITLDLAEKFNVFAPDMVVALISKLARAKLIKNLSKSNVNKWIFLRSVCFFSYYIR